ncbi:MAG: hypothetical protein COA54_11190 [Thiotrichaceae bacterium]|nr:MAG: hypothetical protein COA54_11190 [Thiotrichaceae bacterium]
MFKRFFVCFIVLLSVFINTSTANSNNPFAKNKSVNIGKDVSWNIDKESVLATKSSSDGNGSYYHLQFNNKRLKLFVSSDAQGKIPKSFSQLEIRNVRIDGKQSSLFKWCLNNQQRHSRFLQQGLPVKNNVCEVDGDTASFVMQLNRDTLAALKGGKRLSIVVKPFRTPLDLNYDISDFDDMFLALNAKSVPVVAAQPANNSVAAINKKCWAGPPAKYKNIKSVEYDCGDASAKIDAETWVINLVNKQRAREQKVAAEQAKALAEKDKERQRLRVLAEDKKQKQLAEKLKLEEAILLEEAAIAASAAKQSQLGDEITQKMLKLCDKYWSKGEHRCYCQKYIEHAPSSIQASSSCK